MDAVEQISARITSIEGLMDAFPLRMSSLLIHCESRIACLKDQSVHGRNVSGVPLEVVRLVDAAAELHRFASGWARSMRSAILSVLEHPVALGIPDARRARALQEWQGVAQRLADFELANVEVERNLASGMDRLQEGLLAQGGCPSTINAFNDLMTRMMERGSTSADRSCDH